MGKKNVILLAMAACLVAIGGGVASRIASSAEVVTVRVLRAKVMKAPRFIGPTVASVSRGQQLSIASPKGSLKGSWLLVGPGVGAGGYIHSTNVVAGSVALNSQPGGGAGRTTRDEVELAGRGFTPEVEQQYKNKHASLDFSHVDAIEKAEVDPVSLGEFVEGGGLAFGEAR